MWTFEIISDRKKLCKCSFFSNKREDAFDISNYYHSYCTFLIFFLHAVGLLKVVKYEKQLYRIGYPYYLLTNQYIFCGVLKTCMAWGRIISKYIIQTTCATFQRHKTYYVLHCVRIKILFKNYIKIKFSAMIWVLHVW